VVLDTTEQSEITLMNHPATDTSIRRQTQSSTFSLLKSPPDSAAQYRLLEKEVITDNQTNVTRFRIWTWNPELERFRPAPFDGTNVRPVPPPPKKDAAQPSKPGPR
jgi:hypothetical protein